MIVLGVVLTFVGYVLVFSIEMIFMNICDSDMVGSACKFHPCPALNILSLVNSLLNIYDGYK
jgi:hypothetical protein